MKAEAHRRHIGKIVAALGALLVMGGALVVTSAAAD
jgi:hypothetical protein